MGLLDGSQLSVPASEIAVLVSSAQQTVLCLKALGSELGGSQPGYEAERFRRGPESLHSELISAVASGAELCGRHGIDSDSVSRDRARSLPSQG